MFCENPNLATNNEMIIVNHILDFYERFSRGPTFLELARYLQEERGREMEPPSPPPRSHSQKALNLPPPRLRDFASRNRFNHRIVLKNVNLFEDSEEEECQTDPCTVKGAYGVDK